MVCPDTLDSEGLAAGSLLNRYEIIAAVARGGMGTVWLARLAEAHDFEKLLAIKTILPAFASIDRFRQMLLDEAHLTAKIQHVNVVQVLDVGDGKHGPFIVMEWLEGMSLEKACSNAEARGERVPLAVALRIVAGACEGLHAAHELRDDAGAPLGVVHRDASPLNILVSQHGVTKIIDFGIASGRAQPEAGGLHAGVRGTPSYMAPEQGLGLPVDRRADVWSLGAVLYRVLTGRAPFGRANRLLDFAWGRLSLPRMPQDLPEKVRALLRRALSRDPRERFQTAAEMRHAIEQAMVDARLFATAGDVAEFLRRVAAPRHHSGIRLPATQEPCDDIAVQQTEPLAAVAEPPEDAVESTHVDSPPSSAMPSSMGTARMTAAR
jgi:serine/threonine protein kinase